MRRVAGIGAALVVLGGLSGPLRASSAAISSTLRHSVRQPKPPPTNGFTTRIDAGLICRHWATVRCT